MDSSVSSVLGAWTEQYPRSREMFDRATSVLPGGVVHDGRMTEPFPLYMTRTSGSQKWDLDGHQYIDYWMGHGALILGHSHPSVVAAIQEQAGLGLHYGACHELEVEWARLIQSMVPCADTVRFCSSGTEATLLAMRLARAYTGREKIVRFFGHFHGWQDYAMFGLKPPFDNSAPLGIPDAVGASIRALPDDDINLVADELATGQVAAVMVEPTGSSWGTVPLDPKFLSQLRTVTSDAGVLLVFDEVVSGFRLAPGGAQEHFGVRPDMCTLAKALAGGLPGAAVAGHGDILALLKPEGQDGKKIPHPGTFNGNPLSAAAGIVALEHLRSGHPQDHATSMTSKLVSGINELLRALGIAGGAYRLGSLFHVHFGDGLAIDPDGAIREFDRALLVRDTKSHRDNLRLRRGLLERGVDFIRAGGMLSAAHTEDDIAATLHALSDVLEEMQRESIT